MSLIPYVALAAACGAVARYATDAAMALLIGGDYPWGTFLANVVGSLGLGIVVGALLLRGAPEAWEVVVGTGFLGAYTTFSTWMVEMVRMGEHGQVDRAIGYALISLLAGVLAALAGLGVAALW